MQQTNFLNLNGGLAAEISEHFCMLILLISVFVITQKASMYLFYLTFVYLRVAKNYQIYIYNNKSIDKEKNVFFIPWFHRTTWSRLTLPRLFYETGSIPNPAAFPFVSQTFDE